MTMIVKTPDAQTTTYHDPNLGLAVKHSFVADSGFKYLVGEKDCADFRIQEAVAQGVGISYLCGFKVLIGDQEIVSKAFRDKIYTRDTVRKLVGEALIGYFKEAISRDLSGQGLRINDGQVARKVNEVLDKAYYEQSDAAAMRLLADWGLV